MQKRRSPNLSMTYVTVDFLDGGHIEYIPLNVKIYDYTLHYLFVDALVCI